MVDKAKDAFVFAGMLFIHEIGGEFEADIVVLRLFYGHGHCFATAVKDDIELFFGDIEPIVQNVGDGVAVDRDEYITCYDMRFGSV